MTQYEKALQAVTRADVLRVAKQYLNPANLTIVVTANPTLFGEPLDKLGPVTRLDITIPEAKPEVVETTEASLAQGKQILRRPRRRWAEPRSSRGEGLHHALRIPDRPGGPPRRREIVQTDRWVEPTIFRQDSTLPAGRVSAYTDGKVGWISTPQVGERWRARSAARCSATCSASITACC